MTRVAAAALMAATLAASPTADPARDAAQFIEKVNTIIAFAIHPGFRMQQTRIAEDEINGYLVVNGQAEIPPGVTDPAVAILGSGRVSARAVVDLDAVRRLKQPTSFLDPMSYLTGRLPVTVTGLLTTDHGVGRFTLESASVSGVPIPKFVLQEIVGFYSKAPDTPGGIVLDDPFALPAAIREIQLERGQAIIIQ